MESGYDLPKIKKYLLNCIRNLSERYRKNIKWFEWESDFHSDLYFILNKEDSMFWNKCSVFMGTKENFKGHDLQIVNPNNEKEKITVEIKFWREKDIEKDLKALSNLKRGTGILLYFEKSSENNNKMVQLFKNLHNKYPCTAIYYVHPKEPKDILFDSEHNWPERFENITRL
jgi:hypothetical protein